jgi:hypothetical protein
VGLENYHAERKTTVTTTTNHPNPCHILVLFPTGSKTGSISLWAHLESEESGVSRLLLLSVVVADTEFVIIVLWKKRGRSETWREEKFCRGASFSRA